MNPWLRLALPFALLTLAAGCRSTPTQARITVTAGADVPPLFQLEAAFEFDGSAVIKRLPAAPGAAPLALPKNFTATLPGGAKHLYVAIEGLDQAGQGVAEGETEGDLVVGALTDLIVNLRKPVVALDGGVDLAGADGPPPDLTVPADLVMVPPDGPAGDDGGSDGGLVCAPGSADCNNNPADGCETSIDDDVKNCGGCGKVCSGKNVPNPKCVDFVCVGACAQGFADCDKDRQGNGCETDIFADTNHCGACGAKCAMVCNSGVCGGIKCDPGLADCDKNLMNQCEANLNTDEAHCGACGRACSAVNVLRTDCSGGLCISPCKTGFGDCDNNKQGNGCEVDLLTSELHCGACGLRCEGLPNSTGRCSAGKCVLTCRPGFADCDGLIQTGCERPVGGDVKNCGACGKVCPQAPGAVATCTNALCALTCLVGFSDCNMNLGDGCEATVATDPKSCGACGKACSNRNIPTPTCGGGVCNGACASGYGDCNGDKLTDGCEVSLNLDAANCGKCGFKCAVNQVCSGGVCSSVMCPAGKGDCNGNAMDMCETDLLANVANCGACKAACSNNNVPTPTCGNGACNGTCAANFGDCNGNKLADGCETNLLTDVANCGGCGNRCGALANATVGCVGGKCAVTACNAGYGNCDKMDINGCEASFQTDESNCGACGTICKFPNATAFCSTGTCRLAGCNVGMGNCDGNDANGCETDRNSSPLHCGKCGLACNTGAACYAGVCAKRIFITSTLYSGNLGGLVGADAKCQAAANATALGGTWRAWLSDATTSAIKHLVIYDGPYSLLDGKLVAQSRADLLDGTIGAPIRVTERRGAPTPITACNATLAMAWTNTKPDGSTTDPANHCSNWGSSSALNKATTGAAIGSNASWTDYCPLTCERGASLYCFEQ